MMNKDQPREVAPIHYSLSDTCVICGRIAGVDPSLHCPRYGHVPEITRDGVHYRFNIWTYSFHPVTSEGEASS